MFPNLGLNWIAAFLSCGTLLPCPPTSGPVTVVFNTLPFGGTPGYSYSWSFGDRGTSTLENPTHSYSEAGTYTVSLTVKDAAHHTTSLQMQITI